LVRITWTSLFLPEIKSDENMKQLPWLQWTPDLEHRFWADLAGTEYQAQIAFARTAAPTLVELVQRHLVPDGRVLDYGSGYGLFLVRELLRRDFKAAFFEPSLATDALDPELISNGNFLGGVTTIQGDSFDTVFCSEVLEHLSDADLNTTLGNLCLTLRKGGTLVVTTPDNEDLFLASRYCPVCRHLFHPWGHVRRFSSGDLEFLLTNHGFQVIELHSVDFSLFREPIEELSRLRSVLPILVRDCEEAVSALSLRHYLLASRLRKSLATLGSYRALPEEADPARRNIGVGGTLVAIGKKR
jgi:SAM-dependent methyltransferase